MNSKKAIINNFRNIFVPTEDIIESKQENGNALILSHNSNEGSIVTLIGPNNVGKSNILDAIACSKENYFNNRPDWEDSWNEDDHKVSVNIRDTVKYYKNEKLIDTILSKGDLIFKDISIHLDALGKIDLDNLLEILKLKKISAKEILNFFNISNINAIKVIILLFYIIALETFHNDNDTIGQTLDSICDSLEELDIDVYNLDVLEEEIDLDIIVNQLYNFFKKEFSDFSFDQILLNIQVNNEAKIFRFNEKKIIKTDSLNFDVNSKSYFFEKLSSIIDGNDILFKSILNLTKSGKSESIISGQIDQIILKLNGIIKEKITFNFNKLYFSKNEKYEFKIQRLSSYQSYSFGIFLTKNNGELVVLNLDKQSEGFKWFFDFYFSILRDNNFNHGSIVLLEEPAIHLHIEGQKQWLKFIREFAYKNKVIFVMTTHSPFLIDCDFLDDIRVIYKEGEFTKISNYFSINVNGDKEGSLQTLIQSFTWQNIISTLIDRGDQLILVEGIIDYIYLNHFKNQDEKYKNLHFIPINGLGDDSSMPKVIENIIKNFGFHSYILTDSDEKANKFEELIKENNNFFNIIKIGEINKLYKNIENLFSLNDIAKYDFIKKKRASKIIGLCRSSQEIFDDETKNNFVSLLDHIELKICKNV